MKNRSLYIIIGLLIVVLVLFLIFSRKPYNWSESLENDKENPYDVSLLHEVLMKSTPEGKFITIDKDESISKRIDLSNLPPNSNLISIGKKLYTDSTELTTLLELAENGHRVFIISKWFNADILDTLLKVDRNNLINTDGSLYQEDQDIIDAWSKNNEFDNEEFWEKEWDETEKTDSLNEAQKENIKQIQKAFDNSYIHKYLSTVRDSMCTFNFYDPTLKFEEDLLTIKQFGDHSRYKDWKFFSPLLLANSITKVESIAYLQEGNTNFIKVKYGAGAFYLHTTPFVFTNYNFIQDSFYQYSNQVFENMGDGNIYWDESLKVTEIDWSLFGGNENYDAAEGPLAFILSEPGLKWAWYFILISALLYLLLGVRRKQKAIPVVHQNKNSSIEFAETIGQLYYQKKDHRALIEMKMSHFKNFIHDSYGIRMKFNDQEEKDKLIFKISHHADVAKEKIKHIFDQFDSTMNSSVVSKQILVAFHDSLEEFYNTCK